MLLLLLLLFITASKRRSSKSKTVVRDDNLDDAKDRNKLDNNIDVIFDGVRSVVLNIILIFLFNAFDSRV